MHPRNESQSALSGGETFALKARCIVSSGGSLLSHNMLTISGERIVALGENLSGRPPLDLGDVALLPGLVNAHTHLEFSDLSAPLGERGMAFADWIRAIVEHRRGRSAAGDDNEIRQRAIDAGLVESERCGVAALGEISTSPDPLGAVKNSPLGGVAFLELLGLAADRVQPLVDVARRFLSAPVDGANNRRWRPGLSPHAPYTVHPRLLQQACRLSAEFCAPVAMHLAETRAELQLLKSRSGPLVELLDSLGAWRPVELGDCAAPIDYLQMLEKAHRALVVHGNYLTDAELAWLAARSDRLSVVYCPRTHEYFQHPPYPLAKMLAAGVNVALGTDSRASNPDLNLWEELRFIAAAHPDVPPRTIMQLGTAAGAAALGLGDEIGDIAVGKRADFTLVPLSAPPRSDLCEQLLGEPVAQLVTIVGGSLPAPRDEESSEPARQESTE